MKKIFTNRLLQLILVMITGLFLGWLIFKGEKKEKNTPAETSVSIWTCSMHPQIRQSEPGKCPICGMDLIPLTAKDESANQSPFIHTMSPEAVALANVQTTKVSFVAPEHEVSLTGKIAVNEQKLAVLTANFSGRIEKLFVDFTGQSVRKGEKLASIYSPELVTAQKELLEAAKTKHINPTLYNAVREKLRLWKITEKQIDAIETKGETLTELDIYSDISGIVLSRNISLGDYVNRGAVLFEIADLSTVWILLDAYEGDLSWIKKGDKISFTVASIPGKTFTSTITFVDPLINPQTRTASIRAETANPGMALKPEMFVNATVGAGFTPAQTPAQSQPPAPNGKTLLIPKTAVLWTGPRSVVYIKVPDSEYPAFEMREIVLGARTGDFYIVESGLQEGEEIVTNGVFAIDAAAQLSGNYSMMNRPVSKRIPVSEEFQHHLTRLTEKYFLIKNALVASDAANAKAAALQFQHLVRAGFTPAPQAPQGTPAPQEWINLEKSISNTTALIIKETNIEEHRKYFETLSNSLIEAIELFGIHKDIVYLDYCPMVDDNRGAFWLSEFEEIRNPYFGDKMLKCGSVKKTLTEKENQTHSNREFQSGHQH